MSSSNLYQKLPFHYGWVIVGTGTLVILACLGFGRFSLGMLLPAMGANLGLDYSEMGLISTINFAGYLCAVLVSGLMTKYLGEKRLILTGLTLVGISMTAVSFAQGFWGVLLLYLITGFGAGAANVPIMVLMSHWFGRKLRGRAAGFATSGSGFAIVFSGWVIPLINSTVGAEGWRSSWMLLGLLSLAIMLISLLLIKNRPQEIALERLGDVKEVACEKHSDRPPVNTARMVIHLGLIYFLFGFTYVIYATFIVTTLVEERGFSETMAGGFWMWAGAFSILSGPIFGSLSDRLGRKPGLIMVFVLHTIAYLLIALELSDTFTYLSIFLWGICVWAVPTIMAVTVGDYLGMERAAAVFASITLFFGVGQIVGPGLAGILADVMGGFTWSFAMAAAMTTLAVVLCGALKRPSK